MLVHQRVVGIGRWQYMRSSALYSRYSRFFLLWAPERLSVGCFFSKKVEIIRVHYIFTSSLLHIFKSSHLHIFTLHIFTSSHLTFLFSSRLVSSRLFSSLSFSSLLFPFSSLLFSSPSLLVSSLLVSSRLFSSRLFPSLLFSSLLFPSLLFSSLPFCPFSKKHIKTQCSKRAVCKLVHEVAAIWIAEESPIQRSLIFTGKTAAGTWEANGPAGTRIMCY